MKRTLFVVLALIVAASTAGAAPAAPKKAAAGVTPGLFELGLYLGQPTGISAKYWFNAKNAIDGVAAWNFGGAGGGSMVVAADYLFTFPGVKIETETFPLYVGAGAILNIDLGGGLPHVGARIPLGALYLFREVPLEISIEIVPGLYLLPDTSFLAMGGVGVRYCFR